MSCQLYLLRIFYSVLALVVLTHSQPGGNAVSDSLHYWELRKKIESDTITFAVLETADALANSGLYNEAAEILGTLPSEYMETKLSSNKDFHVKHPKRQWRISLGSDYYHLDDIDTGSMTQDEYKEYQDLTQTPLSIWCRAEYEQSFKNGLNISPQCYISGSRSRIEIPARIALLKDRIDISVTGKAEKWFQSNPSGPDTSKPFDRFDSDMAGLSLKMTPMSEQTDTRMLWEIPCHLRWEHFREDRFGYESKVEYTVSPLLQIRFGPEHHHTFRMNGDIRYRDYYSDISDTLDVIQIVTEVSVHKRSNSGFCSIAYVWYLDQFTNNNKLSSINRWELMVRSEKQLGNTLVPRLSIRINHEREKNNTAIADTGAPLLQGTEFMVHPSVKINLHDIVFIEPEYTFEKRTGKEGYWLWQARSVLEPGFRIGLTSQKYEVTIFSGYRWEKTIQKERYLTPDSRSIRTGFDGTASPLKWLTFNVMLDYQYRLYAPFGNHITENLTAAANVSISR